MIYRRYGRTLPPSITRTKPARPLRRRARKRGSAGGQCTNRPISRPKRSDKGASHLPNEHSASSREERASRSPPNDLVASCLCLAICAMRRQLNDSNKLTTEPDARLLLQHAQAISTERTAQWGTLRTSHVVNITVTLSAWLYSVSLGMRSLLEGRRATG